MPLAEVFDVDQVQKFERRKLYIGGPVQQEALQILQITDSPANNTYTIAPDVHLGGEWEALEDILAADQSTTRLFLGYSGWGPGQLEAEIAVGAWEVYNVNLKKLLNGPEEKLIGSVANIRNYLLSLHSERIVS
jgi:putative transcriptional regulator